jgi:hypothetical protein
MWCTGKLRVPSHVEEYLRVVGLAVGIEEVIREIIGDEKLIYNERK